MLLFNDKQTAKDSYRGHVLESHIGGLIDALEDKRDLDRMYANHVGDLPHDFVIVLRWEEGWNLPTVGWHTVWH
jgi:hypothetical protein